MEQEKNLFVRAFEAMVAGRERQARRFIERYERDYGRTSRTFTKR